MTTTAAAPLDDQGRLLHDDDPAAQVALATARLEAGLRTAWISRTGTAYPDHHVHPDLHVTSLIDLASRLT